MSAWSTLRWILQAVVFPQACLLCAHWCANPEWTPLCARCRRGLRPSTARACYTCGVPLPGSILDQSGSCSRCRSQPPHYVAARSWGLYEGDLRCLLQAYKFNGQRRLVEPLSELLLECFERYFEALQPGWIVPVPLHPSRKRQRGFDQTLLLSKRLGRRTGVPVYEGVRRRRATLPQFGLSTEERRKNVKRAFRLHHPRVFLGAKVLVVDDIMTTGATVDELAGVLRKEGSADSVRVLTVARVARGGEMS